MTYWTDRAERVLAPLVLLEVVLEELEVPADPRLLRALGELRAAIDGVLHAGVDGAELGRLLAGVGVVGQVDGHDVIRRGSVLALVRRRVLESEAS